MRKKLTRTIVITGATGDIAQEIVKRLTDERLILFSRNLTKMSKLYGNLPNVQLLKNGTVISEKVDILINNAGFGVFADLDELSDEQIGQQFQVNAIFPIQLIRDLKPSLQVINIVSIAAKLPTAKASVYAASKAALLIFSDALRMENPKLIVTTINTGPVKTKFHAENEIYLEKVGRNAINAEFVADKIVKNIGKRKRELNLPRKLAFIAKLRALFPHWIDFLAVHFFNYK